METNRLNRAPLLKNMYERIFLIIEGMQQLLVESEGGTVLFESTNPTITQADHTSSKP